MSAPTQRPHCPTCGLHEPCPTCGRVRLGVVGDDAATLRALLAEANARAEAATRDRDAMAEEVARLKSRLATVAERQRQACVDHFRERWVNPSYMPSDNTMIRIGTDIYATPLVTEGEPR